MADVCTCDGSDDCNEVRRKIRQLLKEPGFKVRLRVRAATSTQLNASSQVTHWLEQIGKINNNSYQRFSASHSPFPLSMTYR